MLYLVIVSCCLGLASAAPQRTYNLDQAESHFQDFKETYNKQYSSDIEHETRFNIFKQNLVKINEQNLIEDDVVFGVTEFSDLTPEEFMSRHPCHFTTDAVPCYTVYAATGYGDPVPEEHDWRKFNKVTRVKNQELCGSCWAFSVTGNLEGQYAIVNNELKEFSESQLVDCDLGSSGCGGGSTVQALMYVHENGGIMSEQDYPYQARQRDCQFNHTKVQAQIAGCNTYVVHNEDELKETLYRVGPLAISVDATSFQTYQGNIMKNCSATKLGHAVLLVGYGTENNVPYWIIKNSWGERWGESGYVRVRRNVNACNLMSPRGHIVSAVMNH